MELSATWLGLGQFDEWLRIGTGGAGMISREVADDAGGGGRTARAPGCGTESTGGALAVSALIARHGGLFSCIGLGGPSLSGGDGTGGAFTGHGDQSSTSGTPSAYPGPVLGGPSRCSRESGMTPQSRKRLQLNEL